MKFGYNVLPVSVDGMLACLQLLTNHFTRLPIPYYLQHHFFSIGKNSLAVYHKQFPFSRQRIDKIGQLTSFASNIIKTKSITDALPPAAGEIKDTVLTEMILPILATHSYRILKMPRKYIFRMCRRNHPEKRQLLHAPLLPIVGMNASV